MFQASHKTLPEMLIEPALTPAQASPPGWRWSHNSDFCPVLEGYRHTHWPRGTAWPLRLCTALAVSQPTFHWAEVLGGSGHILLPGGAASASPPLPSWNCCLQPGITHILTLPLLWSLIYYLQLLFLMCRSMSLEKCIRLCNRQFPHPQIPSRPLVYSPWLRAPVATILSV